MADITHMTSLSFTLETTSKVAADSVLRDLNRIAAHLKTEDGTRYMTLEVSEQKTSSERWSPL